MKAVRLLAFCVVAVGIRSSRAADYELATGQFDTISTNASFATMTVAGDLTINSDAAVNITSANTLIVTGGTVTVTGKSTALGRGQSSGTTAKIYNGADGRFGRIIAKNGTTNRFKPDGSTSCFNANIRKLEVRTNDVPVVADGGVVDIIALEGAGMELYEAYNYTAYTNRITVTGSSILSKQQGYSSGNGVFKQGRFLVDLRDNATLAVNFGNQLASFNDSGVQVRVVGDGNLRLGHIYNVSYDYPFAFRKGARLDFNGELRLGWDSDTTQYYAFQADDVIGPGITKIVAMKKNVKLRLSRNVTIKVPDVDLTTSGSAYTGPGRIELDCSRAPHTFTANPASSTTETMLVKSGAYEATVVSTNILRTWVKEGVLRVKTKNCTVDDLRVDSGAEFVVDGVTLTCNLPKGTVRPVIRTENGGKVVFVGDGTTYLYAPAISGDVRVKGGDLRLSTAGIDAKYWRFVFKGRKGKLAPLNLRNIYMFGETHEIENWGLSAATMVTTDSTAALAEGAIRFRYDSSTNVLATGKASWQNATTVYRYTSSDYNANNYPALTAPVLNPDDPASWLTVEMHLKNTARPITGYNLGHGDGKAYPLDNWDVYASANGSDWTLVDSQSGVTPVDVSEDYLTFDGMKFTSQIMYKDAAWIGANVAEFFRLTDYGNEGGLSASGALQLQVDAGAAVSFTNFTETAQTIDALTIDGTVGGGTIHGGTLAAAGRLDVVNYDCFVTESIPIELDGVAMADKLSGWKLYSDGAELVGVSPSYDAGEKAIVFDNPYAYIHVTATSSGDLSVEHPGKALWIEIDSGVAYTNLAALVGDKSIIKTGPGRLVLTQPSNGFSGEIQLVDGPLDGRNVTSNAFGTGTIRILGTTTGTCRLIVGSTTVNTVYDNDIILEGDSAADGQSALFIDTSKQKKTTFNGDITAHGDLFIVDSKIGNSQNSQLVTFNGTVDAAGHKVSYPCDNDVYWKGSITAATFACNSGYPGMGTHSFYAENSLGVLDVSYNTVLARHENAFGGARLYFNSADTANEESRGNFNMNGYDQTVAYLVSRAPGEQYGRTLDRDVNSASTLTLTGGVATATAHIRFGRPSGGNRNYGKVSLVVDAGNDDFTQILTNCFSSGTGTITVKNGALRFAGETSMTNYTSLAVEGGRFELETTTANALRGVTNLFVGATGTLEVGPAAVDAFTVAGGPVLEMAEGSQLELPEGAELTVRRAVRNNFAVMKGVYSGPGGGGEGVIEKDWITGTGILRIISGGTGIVLFIK